jgi:uncharacterized protein YbaP (TraB family)
MNRHLNTMTRTAAMLFVAIFSTQSLAQSQVDAEEVPSMSTVEVKGVLPGPGFWKVSNGENTVWILASIRPVPKRMQWETIKLERKLVDAQLLIGSPSVKLDADIGFFGKIGLLPSLLKARKNPDGKTLQEILPPATYQRWLVMKQKYIGNDQGIESWRPIFAAQELYEKAIAKAGLSNDGVVWPKAEKLAKRAEVPINRPEIKVNIGDPKKFIKAFNRNSLDDVSCFEKTLDSIDRDVQFMAERGRLWAEGDVAGLRRISQEDFSGTCIDALLGSGVAKSAGLEDVPARVRNTWLAAVEQSLNRNNSAVAVINIAELIRPGGMLDRMRAKGYTIIEPETMP